MATRLVERMAFSGGTVGGTADAPVIEGVLLCGPESANRRRYHKEAFAGDRVKRYNGVPVGTYHTDKSGHRYLEQLGLVQNARHRADGMPIGDLAINPEKPGAKAFIWDATHQPRACGMSHVAHCETTRGKDGWEDVTELVEVESVDVIGAGGAATTKGLFEGKSVSLTVRQLAESLVKHPKTTAKQTVPLKLLAEMDGMDSAPVAMDAPPADDADPAAGVSEAFKSAIMHIIGECMDGNSDPKECLQKIKKLLASHGEVNGKSEPPADDAEPAGNDDGPPKESKARKDWADAIFEAWDACDKAKYAPDRADLETIAAVPADRWPTLIERFKRTVEGAGAEQPKAGSRAPGATGSGGLTKTREAAPKDSAEFAAMIRD